MREENLAHPADGDAPNNLITAQSTTSYSGSASMLRIVLIALLFASTYAEPEHGDIVIAKRSAERDVGTLGLSIADDRTIDSFEANSSGLRAGLVAGDVTAATGRVVFQLTLAPVERRFTLELHAALRSQR
jgi:hypothetical protein